MSSWVFFGVLLTVALALAARAILARSHPSLHPMTAPSVEPFLLRYARQAAKERRVVWIRYVEPDKEVIEEKVEIYQTMWNGSISAWCDHQHSRCTFHRSKVLAWQLLDERFEQVPSMGRWAQWEGWSARVRGLKGAIRRH
jgi:hypothetical protein